MGALNTRMTVGVPGTVTRSGAALLEPAQVGDAAIPYGSPVKLAGGKLAPLESGDAADDVYGLLAVSYPSQGGAVAALVDGFAEAGAVVDVLRRGYIIVPLAEGTAAKGGAVHVRVAADTGKEVGDIEADADPVDLAIAGAADEGNTGNATIGAVSVEDGAKVGEYSVVCTAATAFSVYDPDGLLMRADGAFGSAFSAGGVTFTITAGATPCVAGDVFTVTVTASGPGNVALDAAFMGGADADGNVEIAYKI